MNDARKAELRTEEALRASYRASKSAIVMLLYILILVFALLVAMIGYPIEHVVTEFQLRKEMRHEHHTT